MAMASKQLYRLFYKTPLSKRMRNTFLHYHALIAIFRKEHRSNYRKKPDSRLCQQYKSFRMLIRLKQWRISDEVNSQVQIKNARKPKNPE
jgi:hypothetical protein